MVIIPKTAQAMALALQQAGFTLNDIVQYTGISKSTVRHILKGKKPRAKVEAKLVRMYLIFSQEKPRGVVQLEENKALYLFAYSASYPRACIRAGNPSCYQYGIALR